jgi:hypothetical protein
VLALFEYCRSRSMPHPGFVILDSPLIAYKEPMPDDENITFTDVHPIPTELWTKVERIAV